MTSILKVKKLDYKSIFKDFNIEFQKNTLNLITGSNKCGKTTLIKILGGIIRTENVCFYNNKDISKLKSKDFSYIFSSVSFNGKFNFNFSNADQEILFYLDRVDLSASERKMKYKHLVRMFELQDKLYDNIYDLSYFDKIKLLILINILKTPKILILDNILDDLEEDEGITILNLLKKIGGMTIIVSSSTLNYSMQFDKLYIIDKSNVVLYGDPLEVLKEDSKLNKLGLSLPFMVDLSLKLKYYELVDDVIFDMNRMVDKLWK